MISNSFYHYYHYYHWTSKKCYIFSCLNFMGNAWTSTVFSSVLSFPDTIFFTVFASVLFLSIFFSIFYSTFSSVFSTVLCLQYFLQYLDSYGSTPRQPQSTARSALGPPGSSLGKRRPGRLTKPRHSQLRRLWTKTVRIIEWHWTKGAVLSKVLCGKLAPTRVLCAGKGAPGLSSEMIML